MSTAKKQHFVPQFLLKNFAHGKKRKERLWTFDKRRGLSYCASVKDTAHENQFYSGIDKDGRQIEAESLTAFMDDEGSKAVRIVVENERLPLKDDVFSTLSYFVALQLVRVPSVRNQMESLRRALVERWGPEVTFGDDEQGLGTYSEQDSKYASISFLDTVPKFARILRGKIWFLAAAPPGTAFILSDTPVVKHNYLDYGPRGSLGLSQDGIEISFPLSPKLMLQMVCPKIADVFACTAYGRAQVHLQTNGLPIALRSDNVSFANSLQVTQSERYIYAAREIDLQIARSLIAEYPDLAEAASSKAAS